MARPLLPAVRRIGPLASLDELRQAVDDLQEFVQTREPLESGDPLDKYLTLRAAVETGLLVYRGPGGGGSGGGVGVPPDTPAPPPDWDDLTPPDPITGLTVTSLPTGFFVEFDAPSYSQGGGNAYSIIYRANYDGTPPLPTFGDSAEVGRTTERSPILVLAAEPGTISHFWAQPVSHAEDFSGITPQTSPTGGTNGVSATAGKIDGAQHVVALSIGTAQIANLAVTNAKIASLSADKLIANSLAVGVELKSTGFVHNSAGFYLEAGGDAEFNNIVARGTIYATAGLIGGITIGSTNIRSGQTAFHTGTGFWLGIDGSTPKFSIGNPSGNFMYWDGTDLVVNGEFTGTVNLPAFSASIDEGSTFIASRSNGRQVYNTFNVTATGGKSPYAYQWSLSRIDSDNDTAPIGIFITSAPTADNIDISGLGTDNVVIGYITCLVTDSDQRACRTGFTIAVTHGTPP